ncbi:MAG: Gfo/Idh/MocA family oxidoreductase [Candidatus Latescibacterota bacterium]
MARTLRLGIAGCGRRGTYVGSLFRDHPGCRIAALMDPFPGVLQRAAASLGLPELPVFTDYDAFLRDAPVDAVLLTGDPTVQVGMACRAMESGRHACTEVPAAFSLEECWQLVETVAKTGCKYQLMEQVRYWGFVEVWTQMQRQGEFGHICFAQGEYIHFEREWNYWVDRETGEFVRQVTPPPGRNLEPSWRSRVFADPIYYLPHTVSPLLKVLDDRVVRVSCMGTRVGSYTYPGEEAPFRDIEYALMHTARDTVMAVGAGFTLPYPRRGVTGNHFYEVRGTRASVESPRAPGEPFRLWRQGMDVGEGQDLSLAPPDADAQQARSGHGGADFKPVDTLVRAILEDTVPPVDAVLAAQITAPAVLAAESARQGGVLLEVPDFRKPRGERPCRPC